MKYRHFVHSTATSLPNDNFNRSHTIFKCIKGMLYIQLHKVFPTKLTNFFLRTDYKFQNLMAPLDLCIFDY